MRAPAPEVMTRALAWRPCRNMAFGWRSAGVTAIDGGAPSRGLRLRAVALAHLLPVDAVETRIVEAVAHELPHLVEGRAVRFRRFLALSTQGRLGAGRRWPEGERGRNGENVPTRWFHGDRCF